jgi:predicted nicotinamide N-methyase
MHGDIAAVEEELRRRYALREVEVALPGHTLRVLAAEWSEDLVTTETDPDDLPFWAQVWDAGFALASYLLQGPPARSRVLELGAGVGLVGIALALRGGTVIQTDRVVDALRAAQVNADRCGVTGRVLPVAADWRCWPLTQRFTLAVGGDITYQPALHASLLAVLRQSLQPGGIALLADPGRPATDRFARRLMAEGWQLTEYPLPMPGRAAPGRLLRARAP